DLVVVVERLRLDEGVLARGLSTQVALRQRRSMVGDGRVGRDERDPALAAGFAVGLDRAGGGQAAADDRELELVHTRTPCRASLVVTPRSLAAAVFRRC